MIKNKRRHLLFYAILAVLLISIILVILAYIIKNYLPFMLREINMEQKKFINLSKS